MRAVLWVSWLVCAATLYVSEIIFSNDHVEQFFHTVAPPFTVHVGGEATGEFAGRNFRWQMPGEIGMEIVRQLYRQSFDPAYSSTAKIDCAIGIPLTHLGHTAPVLPIYVNAYPKPSGPQCTWRKRPYVSVISQKPCLRACSRLRPSTRRVHGP